MREFTLLFTGDQYDSEGQPALDLALDVLEGNPHMHHGFIAEQQPRRGDSSYQARLYSFEIGPEHVAAADGIVVCRPYVRARAFADGAERLVAIGRAGIGYDKIDLAACTANDVVVFNSPYGLTHSTASAALILILLLSRRFFLQERIIREYRWDLQKDAMGEDLAGRTLGIVGLGHTAYELLRLAAPFGLKAIAYSPHADPAEASRASVRLVEGLDELLRESDYVSLHCRLSERTRKMIGARELGLMKESAFLVNVARGEMIDEEALIECLRERRIGGAGLDVFETEPLPPSSRLLGLDNVILTPHWLASTREAGRATNLAIAEGMLALSRGEPPHNVLNPEVLERPGFAAKLARFRAD